MKQPSIHCCLQFEKTVEPGLPFLVVPVEGEEFRRVEAKQGRGECSLEQSVAPWIDHALEELLQFARFVRGKNVSVALHDAPDPSLAQNALKFLGLTVAAHEYGHVAVTQGAFPDHGSGRMESGDIGAHRFANELGKLLLVQPVLIFHRLHHPEVQRRGNGVGFR